MKAWIRCSGIWRGTMREIGHQRSFVMAGSFRRRCEIVVNINRRFEIQDQETVNMISRLVH